MGEPSIQTSGALTRSAAAGASPGSRRHAAPGARPLAIACAGVCWLGTACSREAESPPDEGPKDNPSLTEDPYFCVEDAHPLAASEETPFGYPVRQLLDGMLPERTASLRWQASAHAYGPESGDSSISLSTGTPGEIHFVDRSLSAREGWVIPEGVTEESVGCFDVVRVQGSVALSTAGGALSDQAPAVFEAGPSGILESRVRLSLDSLVGAFDADLGLPTGTVSAGTSALVVHFAALSSATAGDIWLDAGEVVDEAGATRPGGVERIAHFPAGLGCGVELREVGTRQMQRRVSMASALGRLNSMSPTRATGELGVQDLDLSLEFAPLDDGACAVTQAPVETTVLFPTRIALRSTDGRIDGTLSAQTVFLRAEDRVAASASSFSDDPATLAELPAQFGILDPIDLAGYDASSVEAVFGVDGAGSFGALRAYGMGGPDCGGDAGAPIGADAGAETSCPERERASVWGVSWGSPPNGP